MITNITDKSQIISLWQQSFGDTIEDIDYFLDNCADYSCLGILDGDTLASMLFLVDCKLNGVDYKYIYAACTDKEYRGKGFMTEIIDELKCCNICLIPASDSLVNYYKKRGLTEEFPFNSLVFQQSNEIKDYLFDGYDLTNPCVLARKGV